MTSNAWRRWIEGEREPVSAIVYIRSGSDRIQIQSARLVAVWYQHNHGAVPCKHLATQHLVLVMVMPTGRNIRSPIHHRCHSVMTVRLQTAVCSRQMGNHQRKNEGQNCENFHHLKGYISVPARGVSTAFFGDTSEIHILAMPCMQPSAIGLKNFVPTLVFHQDDIIGIPLIPHFHAR